jgi:hypothetical protein
MKTDRYESVSFFIGGKQVGTADRSTFTATDTAPIKTVPVPVPSAPWTCEFSASIDVDGGAIQSFADALGESIGLPPGVRLHFDRPGDEPWCQGWISGQMTRAIMGERGASLDIDVAAPCPERPAACVVAP